MLTCTVRWLYQNSRIFSWMVGCWWIISPTVQEKKLYIRPTFAFTAATTFGVFTQVCPKGTAGSMAFGSRLPPLRAQ